MYDVCVIGPLTKDKIIINNQPAQEQPGGVAYYASMTLAALGLKVQVLTKIRDADQQTICTSLRKKLISIHNIKSPTTMTFENTYDHNNLDKRTERVLEISPAYTLADLKHVRTKTIYLGPLVAGDMNVNFIKAAAHQGTLAVIDIQGLTRVITKQKILYTVKKTYQRIMPLMTIIKADVKEALTLTSTSTVKDAVSVFYKWGAREIIITKGSEGSLIYYNGQEYIIPACPVAKPVDTTGCGDTYFASYIFKRLFANKSILASAKFASKIAATKTMYAGAFSPQS